MDGLSPHKNQVESTWLGCRKRGENCLSPLSANQAMAFFFGLEVLLNRNRVPLVVEAVKLVGITRPLFRRALGMNLNMQVRCELHSTTTANTAHKPDTVTNRNRGALRRESTLHMHEEEQVPGVLFLNGNSAVVGRGGIDNLTSNRRKNGCPVARAKVNAAVELTLVGSGAGASKNGTVHIVVFGGDCAGAAKALAVKVVDAGLNLLREVAVGEARPDRKVVSSCDNFTIAVFASRDVCHFDKLFRKPDGVVPIRRAGPLHITALLGKVIPVHLDAVVIAVVAIAHRLKGEDLVGSIIGGVDIGVIGVAAAGEAVQALGGVAFGIEAAISAIPPNLVGRTIFGINIDIGAASRIVVQILARRLVRKTVIPSLGDRPFHACHDKISFLILCLVQCPIKH